MSVSKLVGYVPFREGIFLKCLNGLDRAKAVCCNSSPYVCVFNNQRIAYVLLCLERLHEFVLRLFLISAWYFYGRLLAHRDHACVSIALAGEIAVFLCWILLTCHQWSLTFFCIRHRVRGGVFTGLEYRPFCHFNLSKLVMWNVKVVLMPYILILRHASVFHLAPRISLCWLALVGRWRELFISHGDLCSLCLHCLACSHVADWIKRPWVTGWKNCVCFKSLLVFTVNSAFRIHLFVGT